ncbi:MAG: hypothetical protein AAF702_28130 [Chloroflexota bacterium]
MATRCYVELYDRTIDQSGSLSDKKGVLLFYREEVFDDALQPLVILLGIVQMLLGHSLNKQPWTSENVGGCMIARSENNFTNIPRFLPTLQMNESVSEVWKIYLSDDYDFEIYRCKVISRSKKNGNWSLQTANNVFEYSQKGNK